MGSPAGLSGSEPPHAHHNPSLPLHELQLQRVGQHAQDHDGALQDDPCCSACLPADGWTTALMGLEHMSLSIAQILVNTRTVVVLLWMCNLFTAT